MMFKLPSLFGKPSKPRQFLTWDIGTDYVKCLVFDTALPSVRKLSIQGIGKQPLGYLYTRGGAIVDYEGVKEASEVAIAEALSSADSKTRDVVIGLSGEMTKGLVTTVRLTRTNPNDPISEGELSKVVAKIQDTAFLEASKEVAMMTGNPDLELDLTNSSISSVKIDGTFIGNPIGMTGERIEIALFTAFSPSFHIEILDKLAKKLKLKILAVSSEMYALSKSLTNSSKDPNMILMDIGGETTDVGIVFGGGLIATRTLSLGGRHLTRAISETFGLPFTDAEEKKLRYSLGTLSPEEMENVEACLRNVLEIWISGVELLFSDFDGVKTFPSKIYLIGGGSSLGDVLTLLEKEPWTRNIPFKEPPVFERVSVSDLSYISDLTGKTVGHDDVMPAALSEVYLELKDKV